MNLRNKTFVGLVGILLCASALFFVADRCDYWQTPDQTFGSSAASLIQDGENPKIFESSFACNEEYAKFLFGSDFALNNSSLLDFKQREIFSECSVADFWNETSTGPCIGLLEHVDGWFTILTGRFTTPERGSCIQLLDNNSFPRVITKEAFAESKFQKIWIQKNATSLVSSLAGAEITIDKPWSNFGLNPLSKNPASDVVFKDSFVVTNSSPVPLVLEKTILSCKCMAAEKVGKKRLEPGEQFVLDFESGQGKKHSYTHDVSLFIRNTQTDKLDVFRYKVFGNVTMPTKNSQEEKNADETIGEPEKVLSERE